MCWLSFFAFVVVRNCWLCILDIGTFILCRCLRTVPKCWSILSVMPSLSDLVVWQLVTLLLTSWSIVILRRWLAFLNRFDFWCCYVMLWLFSDLSFKCLKLCREPECVLHLILFFCFQRYRNSLLNFMIVCYCRVKNQMITMRLLWWQVWSDYMHSGRK